MIAQERLMKRWGEITDGHLDEIKIGLAKILYY